MIFLQITGMVLAIIVLIALGYALLILLGAMVPVNSNFKSATQGVKIGVSSNGVHADFVLPVVHPLFDWRNLLNPQDYQTKLDEDNYLSFGWGDEGFYLDIDTWAELTAKVAVKAVLIPSKTLMHITAHTSLTPKASKASKHFHISESQYLQLCAYISQHFVTDEKGEVKLLAGEGYTPDDNFYTAHGYYHACYTCNSWVNRGLRKIGVRTALWSPLYKGIFYQLQKL